jgi:hypothetical protein
MADDEQPRTKNPFAIPMSALVGDGGVAQDQLVTLQPHQEHTDWVPAGGIDAGGDGDGD